MNGTQRGSRSAGRWGDVGRTIVVVVVMVSVALAWRQWSTRNAYGAATERSRPPESAETVLAALDGVGLECPAPAVSAVGRDKATGSCRGEHRYDLKIQSSSSDVPKLIELARGVGCMGSAANPRPSQWFTVQRNNWVLFTLDAEVAQAAMHLPGTVVSTALCMRYSPDRVE